MKIAIESLKILAPILCISLILSFFSIFFSIAGLVCCCLVAFFFRDPTRNCPQDPHSIYAPADGTIVSIEPCLLEERNYWKIHIFLSVFNCHINRAPFSGKVVSSHFIPGSFKAAYKHGIENKNQRQESYLETSIGLIKIVQITGYIARRIACRLQAGQAVKAGQKFGLIYFGSRTDLYIPQNCEILVKTGMKTQAGLTQLAHWKVQE